MAESGSESREIREKANRVFSDIDGYNGALARDYVLRQRFRQTCSRGL